MVEDFIADELAVIFEPIIYTDGTVEAIPLEVIEGYFDEVDEKFIDKDVYSYSHLSFCENGRAFAFRRNISALLSNNPDKTLNEIKEDMFNEIKEYNYMVGFIENEPVILRKKDGEDTQLMIDEDTMKTLMFLSEDTELEEMILARLEEKGIDLEEELPIQNVDSKKEKNNLINPHALYKEIKKTVKGQDDAIKEIVTTVWENYTSDYTNNMILVGSSGTGKTEILRQLADKLDIPLLITAVSGMSQAGYVGTGTDEILSSLVALTKGDVEKAERAIVVLDEIDKLAFSGYSSGKISTDGVQNELLKIVEDGTFAVSYGKFDSKIMLNTKNITFIGVGAFNGMLTTTTEKQMGFGNDIYSKEKVKDKITSEDLIKYGLKPELVGRMGKIVKLNDLDLEILKEIIKNSNKSAYVAKLNFIKKYGICLEKSAEEEIIEEIARVAISKKVGARAITGIVNEMFSDILFDIADPEEKYTKLEIFKETVTDSKKYILRK